jgi:parallel beta-helix repeat protein
MATTGVLSIDCASNARHGTAAKPITVMAENERRALIVGDGQTAPVRIQNCSYWRLQGLYTRQTDNARAPGGTGFNVHLQNSNHLTVQRCLAYGANRYTNVSIVALHNTHDSLVEECEAYFFHRKGISLGEAAARNVIRRNYIHSRAAADVCQGCEGDSSGQSARKGDEGINLGYPGSDNIAENNISEGSYIGFVVNAKGTSDRNKFYGNVAIDNDFGFVITSRGAGATRTPHDTVLSNNVVMGSNVLGVYLRGAENTRVNNLTVLDTVATSAGHGLAADHSSLDYITQAAQCNSTTSPCGNGASSTHIVNSLVLNNSGTGFNIATALQEGGWSISYSNAYNNRQNYSPSTAPNLTNVTALNPSLGSCRLWIPDGSRMKTAGRNGADIGATILYRYHNGGLTSQPLWDTLTGAFPSGFLVTGVNDVAGQSAFDVNGRLNVNVNGCAFPLGYAN